ncbi:hypothetical protein AB0K60_32730 [Thermopolyspora sp. NPDC052614]|uniref:hypothetical protein n=1 Tax=Thermopolyspora sp. NPDC052614 TaxID=3155682 RepID=UPI0034220210
MIWLRRHSHTAVALALVGFLTACGGTTTDKDAAAIIGDLAANGVPAKLGTVYDENTDPNKLLGRPNGYLSKAEFTDSRVKADKAGSVEVFEDASGAEARAEYIQALGKNPMLAEYTYVKGNVVVRVDKDMAPSDAKTYEDALNKIVE